MFYWKQIAQWERKFKAFESTSLCFTRIGQPSQLVKIVIFLKLCGALCTFVLLCDELCKMWTFFVLNIQANIMFMLIGSCLYSMQMSICGKFGSISPVTSVNGAVTEGKTEKRRYLSPLHYNYCVKLIFSNYFCLNFYELTLFILQVTHV